MRPPSREQLLAAAAAIDALHAQSLGSARHPPAPRQLSFDQLRACARASCPDVCFDGFDEPAASHEPPSTSAAHECCGHLVLSDLVMYGSGLRPCVPMNGGDAVAFLAYALTHGTTLHHLRSRRRAGCAAHVSVAVQSNRHLLRLSAAERDALEPDFTLLAALDARERFPDALWLEVTHITAKRRPTCRTTS